MSNINPNANVMDPWEAAGTEYVPVYEYYGQVQMTPVWMVFPGEKGSGQRPVVYNPQAHAGKRPFLQIEARLNVIPDQPLNYAMEQKWTNFDQDWNKITMPSIRALGFIREDNKCDTKRFNGQWVKLESVEGFRPNKNNPEKGNYKTWKFTAVYKDRDACRQAYLAEHPENGAPVTSAPQQSTIVPNNVALQFIETTINEAYKGGAQYEDVVEKVRAFITANASACGGLTVDSPEVRELLEQVPF